MKKNYQKPAMRVVKLQHRSQLLVGSDFTKGNALRGGGSDQGYYDPNNEEEDYIR